MEYKYFIYYSIKAGNQDMEGNCIVVLNRPISDTEHIVKLEENLKEQLEPDIFAEVGEEVDVKVLICNFIRLPN